MVSVGVGFDVFARVSWFDSGFSSEAHIEKPIEKIITSMPDRIRIDTPLRCF